VSQPVSVPMPGRRVMGFSRPSSVRPWWFALLALAVALFIIYGSYVPFQFRARTWEEATVGYEWALKNRFLPESRADWLANIALGIPLGFAFMGWLRLDRKPGLGTVLAALAIIPAATLFAAIVEFGQLYCLARTCAGSDIWAQGLGSIVGIIVWIAAGPWFVRQLRVTLDQDSVRSSTLPLLCAYFVLLLLTQWLPFDLSASPKDLLLRLKQGTTWVPFSDLLPKANRPPVDDWKKLADWLQTIALYLPAGALLAGLPGRWRNLNGLGWVVLAGLGLGVVLEAGQLLVQSRHPSTTDILLGAIGFVLGWVLARAMTQRRMKNYRVEWALVFGQVWFALLAFLHWQPFDFFPSLTNAKFQSMSWLPLAGQAEKNYLWALNEILEKFAVFLPLGALVVWASTEHHRFSRTLLAGVVGLLCASVLEIGQAMLPSRYVSPTDVLFGFFGALLGGDVTRRLMGVRITLKSKPTVEEKKVSAPPAPVVVLPEVPKGLPWWSAAEERFPGVPFQQGKLTIQVRTPPPPAS
jgi:VanZ family protein